MAKFAFLSSPHLKQELKAYLLGILLWIPVGFIFIPIYIAFFIYRGLVHFLAEKFRPDLIPASKADLLLGYSPSYSPHSFAYTCQVWKVKGEIDVFKFRNHFQQVFLTDVEDQKKYINLYCYFVNFLGYVFKKKVEQLDLKEHIQTLELKKEETVEGYVGQWMATHDFDLNSKRKAPVWMIKIIPQPNRSTTVVFKLHHGICDGYTIVHLVGKLSGEHAPYTFKDPTPPLIKRLKCVVQFPYICAHNWAQISLTRKNFLAKQIITNDNQTTPVDKTEWLISFGRLDLETVKAIRRMTNVNFVSILMSIHVGALKRLMLDMGMNEEDFLKKVDKTFIGHSMGWPNHPVMVNGGGMTNHLTLNIIKASLSIDDPLERLLDLDKYFRHTKYIGNPVISYYIMLNMIKFNPSWVNEALLSSDIGILATENFLSTLLCSPNPHYLLGNPVEELYLPVLTSSVAPSTKLFNVPVSHSGVLDISVNGAKDFVKSQEMLDRLTKVYFPYELEMLKNRIGNIRE